MNDRHPIAHVVQGFFQQYLTAIRNLSEKTVLAYRDAIKLLLCHVADTLSLSVDALSVEEIGEKIVSKALDNRIACWLGIEAIRGLGKARHACEIHVAFTSQEEVGLRGARTASFAIAPDIGLGIDTTLACDTPGVPEQDRTTEQGKGFGLHVKDSSFIADRERLDLGDAAR